MTDEQKEKIGDQKDTITDQEKEIEILQEKIESLEKSDVKNFLQHKEIMDAIKANNEILRPIADTYKTVGVMSKWIVALLVFISLVGGTIITWKNVFNK